jgi:hypothetical protein
MNELFAHFPKITLIDEVGKILSRKIWGAFHKLIKLFIEDFVGLTKLARITL